MSALDHHPLRGLIISQLRHGDKSSHELRYLLLQIVRNHPSEGELRPIIESGNFFRFLHSMEKFGLVTSIDGIYHLETPRSESPGVPDAG